MLDMLFYRENLYLTVYFWRPEIRGVFSAEVSKFTRKKEILFIKYPSIL